LAAFREAAYAQSSDDPVVAELKSLLENRDVWPIVRFFGDIAKLREGDPIIGFVVDLWEARSDKHPDLPWDFVMSDPVRLHLGHELLIWSRLGMPSARIDRQQIRDYAVKLIDDPRGEVRDVTLTTLGALDEPVDVGPVLAVAKSEPFGRFALAVEVLSGMCNPAARDALLELEQYVQTEGHRKTIAAIRRRHETWKDENPTLCD
jgi:hypothetical protein